MLAFPLRRALQLVAVGARSMTYLTWLYAAWSCITPNFAQAQVASEDELKAAFIYNFSKYAELPNLQQASDTSFSICVAGKIKFDNLAKVVEGKKIGAQVITVKNIALEPKQVSDAKCQIVYVSADNIEKYKTFLSAMKPLGVLTIGDIPGFCEAGGVINFLHRENKIRFEISLKNAKESQIQLSSQLLKLAKIVTE